MYTYYKNKYGAAVKFGQNLNDIYLVKINAKVKANLYACHVRKKKNYWLNKVVIASFFFHWKISEGSEAKKKITFKNILKMGANIAKRGKKL